MKKSLFDIGEEFNALYELANDVEYDENGNAIDNSLEMIDLFNEIQSDLVAKCDNTNYIIKEIESDVLTLDNEIKRLQAKKKSLVNKKDRLKELIKTTILLSGEAKVKGKFSYSISDYESFNYDDVSTFGLSEELVKVKTELDKTKIKEFVKAGGSVDGLRIENKQKLSIR
jgi:DNA repair ATPase RecN